MLLLKSSIKSLSLPQQHPKKQQNVLLLMGMPGGSFLVGTKHSYVGDLINQAGGHVVGSGSSPFVSMNAEQVAQSQPTVIITMAHAMPDSVFKILIACSTNQPGKTFRLLKRACLPR